MLQNFLAVFFQSEIQNCIKNKNMQYLAWARDINNNVYKMCYSEITDLVHRENCINLAST